MKAAPPAIPSPRRQRGAALMVVMLLILAMVAIAGAFAYAMKVETLLSMRTQSTAELDWLARSGVEHAKWILDTQRRIPGENTFDALNQFWAGGPGPTNTIDNPFLDVSLDHVPVGEGEFSLRITDAERRMNINNLNQNQLELMFQLAGAPGGDAKMMAEAVLDWRDRDDFDRGSAPSEGPTYYLNLDPPYRAKNGPLDAVSELLRIRGFTPEIYWGAGRLANTLGGALPTPAFSFPRGTAGALSGGVGAESAASGEGLVDLLCAVSNGRVNINTAGLGVLRAIFAGDEVIPTQILQRRQGPDGIDGTLDDLPFRSVAELGALGGAGGGPGGTAAVAGQGLLVTQSSTFEVRVQARLGRSQRTYRALVRRGGSREIQVMVFHPE
ncbi:MAG: general secretion pathway protein GspK [Verrucomicrobiota bacterium]